MGVLLVALAAILLFASTFAAQPAHACTRAPPPSPEEKLRRAEKALQKLTQLHVAEDLEDLRVPPGNKLEKLVGDRAGQHSIRVNQQYRVAFVWEDGDAYEVEIVDYHKG